MADYCLCYLFVTQWFNEVNQICWMSVTTQSNTKFNPCCLIRIWKEYFSYRPGKIWKKGLKCVFLGYDVKRMGDTPPVDTEHPHVVKRCT